MAFTDRNDTRVAHAIAELRVLGRAGLKDLAMDPSDVTSAVRTEGAGRRR